ncbi:MAG: DNRLRE domain-containing protein [Nannocystaceae bacterium]
MACAGLGLLAWFGGAARARAETVCGTVAEFNAAMADAGTVATDVTLTFDLVGVNPADFPGGKGSLAQMRNSTCATGQDAGIKVYGPDDPPNDAHPSGTLKMEYGNSCCGGTCGEHWADPNASAVVFVDGTETCNVTMWMRPTEAGYTLLCNVGQFDGLGDNPEGNAVDAIVLLEFVTADGGTIWGLPNATASNDQVCWEAIPSDMMTVTVPVIEDVAAGPGWPDTVFPDPTDLAVEADGTTAYLKFDVPQIEGKITGARLSMHVSTAPSSDGDGGEVHLVTDSTWSESTMTWNTRPAFEPASLGRIGPGAADTPLSIDLGTAIDQGGTWSLAVFSPPTDGNGTHFWSKEGNAAAAASLRIEYVVVDADGDGTPDGPDCDDADADVSPDADESCNGIDDDCDGMLDEGCGADSGGSDGGSGVDSGVGTGSDGGDGGSEDGAALPNGPGQRGADTSCACATDGAPSPAAWLWLAVVGGLRRRRRPQAVFTPPTSPVRGCATTT